MLPGKLIAIEGLDETGKTTALSSLSSLDWEEPRPLTIHLPSGLSPWTQDVYELLLHRDISAPLARQLLHLACHAETIPLISKALETRAVFLDRSWWSTLAYGSTDRIEGTDAKLLRSIVENLWGSISIDLVFLFLEPHDSAAYDQVLRESYETLAATSGTSTMSIPRVSRIATVELLVNHLIDHKMLITR